MKKICSAVILASCLAGCVPSVNPIYREQDIVFEPELVGAWADEDGEGEYFLVSKGDGKSYSLVYGDDEGREGTYVMHLVDLGGHLFFDFYPEHLLDQGVDMNEMLAVSFISAHSFALVHQTGPEVTFSFMDPEWLGKYLDEYPRALEHERVEDDLVIIKASTRRLQRFLKKHAKTEGAFGDVIELQRQSSGDDE